MGGWLAVIFVGLVLLAYLFMGIGWLFTHELPLMISILVALGVIVILIIVSIAYAAQDDSVGKRSVPPNRPNLARAKSIEARANRAVETLVRDRTALEREARKLEGVRSRLRGDVNFQILVQQHHESRLLADSWHTHKNQAITSRKELASGIRSFETYTRQLAQSGHGGASREIGTAKSTIRELPGVACTLQGEIDRGSIALDEHNKQTGFLRDHILDACGPRGRKWYDDLQRRKRDRDIDN
jgi:hypothetical protein